jgi:hypothetical protein
MIVEVWELDIGPTIIKCEMCKKTTIMGLHWMFAFNLNEICQLKGQKVCIMLEDVNPIFKPPSRFRKKREPWFKLRQ